MLEHDVDVAYGARWATLRGIDAAAVRRALRRDGKKRSDRRDMSWVAAWIDLEDTVVDEGSGTVVEFIHSGECLDGLDVPAGGGVHDDECRESRRRGREAGGPESKEWRACANMTMFLASSPATTCTDDAAHLLELRNQIRFGRVISATTDDTACLALPTESLC
uniref:Uncharacterized protein n=1 Tax=Oryza punctata TaxID=4537 RepID=A0A0E0LV85_ORYPU